MELSIGPIDLRFFSGDNYTRFEVAAVTNRKGGMARRETAINIGYKSDHWTEAFGRDNPNDRYVTPDGNIIFGKISFTPGGGVHVLSAAQVYAASLSKEALKAAATEAAKVEPVTVTVETPATAQPDSTPGTKPAKAKRTPAARR